MLSEVKARNFDTGAFGTRATKQNLSSMKTMTNTRGNSVLNRMEQCWRF